MKWSDIKAGDVVSVSLHTGVISWEAVEVTKERTQWVCLVSPDSSHYLGETVSSSREDEEIGGWKLDDSFQHWVNKVRREAGVE